MDKVWKLAVAVLSIWIFILPIYGFSADMEADYKAYERGDTKARIKEWKSLAEQGEAAAQFSLGNMYRKGKGVTQDYKEAVKWYRKAAEQGDASAQFSLGFMYLTGKGIPQDDKEAFKWYRKAAEQGDASAQSNLGNMYSAGEGIPQDYAEAIKWYKKAAEQGYASAQYNLGAMYSAGEGIPQDDKEAFKWYKKAAEQGYAIAQYNLGVMYDAGTGVPQDYAEAIKWYKKAAEQGDASAQFNLGVMYYTGEGAPQDYVQAYRWWNIAAAQGGDNKARENRELIRKEMTPGQIAEAQRLSTSFNVTPSKDQNKHTPKKDQITVERTLKLAGSGSGFIVNSGGYMLTNHHVVDDCSEVRVSINENSAIGSIIASNAANDLALLKIPVTSDAAAKFRFSQRLRLGESVLVAGYPLRGLLADGLNISTGEVSALAGPGNDARFVQISAPVQKGNSGGPLLDNAGNIIGVIVGKLNAIKVAKLTGSIPQNINFAIKGAVARSFLDVHSIDYETARSMRGKDAKAIAEKAKTFTVPVECYQ